MRHLDTQEDILGHNFHESNTNNENKAELSFCDVSDEHSFAFYLENKEAIRISKNGFYYKGEKVEDALEVYKRFDLFLNEAGYK